jgi:hypothetical protein
MLSTYEKKKFNVFIKTLSLRKTINLPFVIFFLTSLQTT